LKAGDLETQLKEISQLVACVLNFYRPRSCYIKEQYRLNIIENKRKNLQLFSDQPEGDREPAPDLVGKASLK